jgi:hypothetical protein
MSWLSLRYNLPNLLGLALLGGYGLLHLAG